MTIRVEAQEAWRTGIKKYLRLGGSLVLFTVGAVSLCYCGIVLLDARQHQADQSRRFDQAFGEAQSPSGDAGSNASPPLPAAIVEGVATRSGIPDPPVARELPLGRIEVKSLGIVAMVEEGTAIGTLQRALGHIQGTPMPGQPGNVGIAGHRDTFFRNLRNVQDGDELTLTTLAGIFRYRVLLISIVEPNDTTALANSEESILTLVTCYPFSFVGFAPKRFIVRAILIEVKPR